MAPILLCLQWRPKNVDRGPPPQVGNSGRGAKGAAHGHYISTGGGLQTQWAYFTYSEGERGGTQSPVNIDTAPLTEPSYDCLSPRSTLPAQHGPHCLPPCNTNSHTLFPPWLAQKDEGTLNGLSQDKPPPPTISPELTRWHWCCYCARMHFRADSAD